MTEKRKFFLVFALAVYVGLNLLGPYLAFFVTADERKSTPNLRRVSLYDNKKGEYYKKIVDARKLFRSEPAINEPFYIVRFGESYYNAEYDLELKCIVINEGLAQDFSLEMLSAIIAHEFAHAEVEEKTGSKDTREHWRVDMRAAELTNPDWVEAVLLKSMAQDEDYRKVVKWLKSKRVIFWMAYYFMVYNYEDEYDTRLYHVRMMKKSG